MPLGKLRHLPQPFRSPAAWPRRTRVLAAVAPAACCVAATLGVPAIAAQTKRTPLYMTPARRFPPGSTT